MIFMPVYYIELFLFTETQLIPWGKVGKGEREREREKGEGGERAFSGFTLVLSEIRTEVRSQFNLQYSQEKRALIRENPKYPV